ncbi:MAG TPA: hypothetical protein VHO69_04910 [Phototrophicaceae bacterium]|nr:hypothetical protein [Phototrophicaceae bacterium]
MGGFIQRSHQREKGQGLVEYALILVLVAIVVIVALSALGPQIAQTYGDIQCSLKYGKSAVAEYSVTENTGICFEITELTDGSKQKNRLGFLFDT